MQETSLHKSPGPLRTDISHSTAQNTVARPQASMEEQGINGGPSVGIEDSKFLMEVLNNFVCTIYTRKQEKDTGQFVKWVVKTKIN